VELEVDNAKGELFPGGYTEVHFKMPAGTNRVHIPANALIYRRNGLMVAAPDAAGRVNLKPITVGRDYGTVIEVTSGLAPNETVIVNPPDSLVQNQQVRIVKGAEDQPGHKKP
jgi:multidrug efflux pump subunit AcrA (membrane-fusion protein)